MFNLLGSNFGLENPLGWRLGGVGAKSNNQGSLFPSNEVCCMTQEYGYKIQLNTVWNGITVTRHHPQNIQSWPALTQLGVNLVSMAQSNLILPG